VAVEKIPEADDDAEGENLMPDDSSSWITVNSEAAQQRNA
jgi:hypothetical protein